ncbi:MULTISPECIES: transposase [Cysteiniphilum]|uniref:transposase n=1 Tax=Cysteiniphilum TaxID=2056696 RepID=UPI001782A8D3|nr:MULTISPECIES: transposase [Cysteiniphilum]
MSEKHYRHTVRLKGYDYAQKGAYFVTVCTHDKACLFGEIVDDKMMLNEMGEIVYNEWLNTSVLRNNIHCDVFVVMPNHIHGIIVINESAQSHGCMQYAPTDDGHVKSDVYVEPEELVQYAHTSDMFQAKFQSPSQTVGAIVRGFKAAVTKQINALKQTRGETIWQRNYYEHVIRDENDYS